ncbi:translocase of chloroplast 101, chloroplastic-like isoform X1 [Zingiber officinale]|uniref:translocase of chloroplast 101, chloroplastic-like isoform X1 n=1 Tax=Zingiber officinale TaxID=94328 RepID=UPI001C4D70C2|nr:translocase of chloroplast 101, chloroplastic-like isoform X1 [Zingiber officinale]
MASYSDSGVAQAADVVSHPSPPVPNESTVSIPEEGRDGATEVTTPKGGDELPQAESTLQDAADGTSLGLQDKIVITDDTVAGTPFTDVEVSQTSAGYLAPYAFERDGNSISADEGASLSQADDEVVQVSSKSLDLEENSADGGAVGGIVQLEESSSSGSVQNSEKEGISDGGLSEDVPGTITEDRTEKKAIEGQSSEGYVVERVQDNGILSSPNENYDASNEMEVPIFAVEGNSKPVGIQFADAKGQKFESGEEIDTVLNLDEVEKRPSTGIEPVNTQTADANNQKIEDDGEIHLVSGLSLVEKPLNAEAEMIQAADSKDEKMEASEEIDTERSLYVKEPLATNAEAEELEYADTKDEKIEDGEETEAVRSLGVAEKAPAAGVVAEKIQVADSNHINQISEDTISCNASEDLKSSYLDGNILDPSIVGESGEPVLVSDAAEESADATQAASTDGIVGVYEVEESEQEEGFVSDVHARVAIIESSETAKQIIQDMEKDSSSHNDNSVFMHDADGEIVVESDEEVDTDEDGSGEEIFDSAALTALLKAAAGASPDGNITLSSQGAGRIFSAEAPAGLGSSVSTLKSTAPRSLRSSLFTPSDLSVVGDDEIMDEEERKLHDKVEQIRVKFLRLVLRLGHSPDDIVAAQVLHRLGLAEGIKRARQNGHSFSVESAKRKAMQLEADGKEDLNFSCNILVLGKTGVGKSATINSIFGDQKTKTNAFQPATTYLRQISGTLEGINIRVVDTPGLSTSAIEQSSNRKVLISIKKFIKSCPPDIVLYVDRLDTQTRNLNDLPLLRSITSILGSSIWFNAIVALTHAASAPPEGPNGSALSYEMVVAQRSHVVQQCIRQAAGDMRLMNPVALVENHPSCRRNKEGERVLPNGKSWRTEMLLLCYSSKILSEANSLLKLQDASSGKLFNFRFRSPPLPYLLSSLLQSRTHPKLSADQGGENDGSDFDLDDLSDINEEEDEYDQLPPFKPLKKAQLGKLTKEQRNAYFDEYDYRVKLLQKKQLKEELRRIKEMKKRGKNKQDDLGYGYGDISEGDQEGSPASVPVPLPDMSLPPSFDCDNPVHRYRFLEPTSQLLTRPVLDTHGWDHDCGYDGVSIEQSLALANCFPAAVAIQVTKDKKEFSIQLDSSICAKHGENGSTLAGFDIQSVGRQLAYILRGETKFKNFKKNKTAGGISITFLGETIATGLKVEDQITIGKRVNLVASTGTIRSQGDVAFGANLEARLRDKDYPIGQALSTLGLSLMKWHGDLALGANLQSQFSIGRNSKMAVRVGLNNKLSGQITVKTSTSEQLQIALIALVPTAVSLFRSFWAGSQAFLQHSCWRGD